VNTSEHQAVAGNGRITTAAEFTGDDHFGGMPVIFRRGRTGASVVALCGSRSAEAVRQAEADLTAQGRIVLPPFTGAHLAAPSGPAGQELLRALHRAKIAMADEVVVVNPEHYFTDAGIGELTLALDLGLPVSFTEPIPVMDLREDLWQAVLAGTKSVEVRRLDAKRLALRPGEVIRFRSGDRALLARVLVAALAPATVVPGGDRNDVAILLEDIYPGLFADQIPMVAIEIDVVGELPVSAPPRALHAGYSVTWHSGRPPAGTPVAGAAGWLIDPIDGRVLVQQHETASGGLQFTLPGGRGEPGDGADLLATLVREAMQESQVEIDAASAVYLGCQIVTGHPDRPDPYAKARFVAPISLYEPIGPNVDDPARRTYRRYMTSINRAAELLGAGDDVVRLEAVAAWVAARALRIPVDSPAADGFRDAGDPDPLLAQPERGGAQ
jgi:8-oxo-dGTP pyrophosphatase MutT (NUDIX family)